MRDEFIEFDLLPFYACFGRRFGEFEIGAGTRLQAVDEYHSKRQGNDGGSDEPSHGFQADASK